MEKWISRKPGLEDRYRSRWNFLVGKDKPVQV